MNRLLSLLVVAFALLCTRSNGATPPPKPAPANPPPAKPAPLKPGDARLLDDLPKSKDSSPPADAPAPKKPEPTDEEGEDIGQESPSVRLERIGRQMATVEQRLRAGDSTRSTQALQDRIVGDLDGFLKQSNKQTPGKSQKKPDSGTQADASGGGNLKPKDEPAEKGTPKDSGASSGSSDKPTRADMTKEVWGELPPQIREQLLNALPEKFLPAYESLIEEYYRRLAERKRK